MKLVTICLSMVLFGVLAVTVFAGSMPDYQCARQAERCERSCDEGTADSKNPNAYQRCLDRCADMSKRCEERQKVTTGCAESFKTCIKSAAGDQDALEGCRESYRQCKGH